MKQNFLSCIKILHHSLRELHQKVMKDERVARMKSHSFYRFSDFYLLLYTPFYILMINIFKKQKTQPLTLLTLISLHRQCT